MDNIKQKLRRYAIDIALKKNELNCHDCNYWQDLAVFLLQVAKEMEPEIIINSLED